MKNKLSFQQYFVIKNIFCLNKISKKNISVFSTGYSMPPVIITVDYGDGSGEQSWSRAAPANLWTHMYQLPGRYWVHVSSESLLIPS